MAYLLRRLFGRDHHGACPGDTSQAAVALSFLPRTNVLRHISDRFALERLARCQSSRGSYVRQNVGVARIFQAVR